MVTIETVEGLINGAVSYHYDVFADVLYLRLRTEMQTPAIGDVNDDGDIELHEETTDRLVGVTIISWWKRFSTGELPDSIAEVQKYIEPLAGKVTA